MPYARMARNLNQSVFAFIVGTAFSAILLALFSIDAIILAIFEIPLAFLVALIAVTECIYSYREDVSLQTTYDMLKSLLKVLLYSIPIVGFYSAILLILYKTVAAFENALVPLFQTLQGLNEIAAIILMMYIPIFLMLFATPILLYFYGKFHIFLWKPKEEKQEEKEMKIDAREKEVEEKVFQTIDQLDQNALQLQQYFLELQGMIPLIDSVNDTESYKILSSRLTMMNDYIETLIIEEDKDNKQILEEEDVKRKINEVDIQKKTIMEVVQQNIKKLKKEKGQFEEVKEEAEYYTEEKKSKRKKKSKKPEVVEETKEEEIIEDTKEEEATEPEEVETTVEEISEDIKENITEQEESETKTEEVEITEEEKKEE